MSMNLDPALDRALRPSRTVSAFFDTHEAAQKASDDLVAAGIPSGEISLTAGQGAGEAVGATAHTGQDRGFWQSLKDLFLPEPDQNTYAEGLRRGGYLLTVRTDDAAYDRVLDILDADGAVNMDERESLWRSEGWNGLVGDVDAAEASQSSRGLFGGVDRDPAQAVGTAPATAMDASIVAANAGTLPPDNIRSAASRDVSHGRARVRSYIDDSDEGGSFFADRDRDLIVEHMDVIASDGTRVGTVDHLEGPDKIKLARSTAPDGRHHYVPLAWIDHVDTHIHLNRNTAAVTAGW